MRQITTRLGGLECRIVDDLPDGAKPELAVVLCHGYGASGSDLVPLAGEIERAHPGLARRVRFVFPAAPLTLEGPFNDARAWWHLDVEAIQRAMMTGDLRDLRNELPEGLPHARRLLMAAIDALTRISDLSISRVVLGGFSQGAMLSTDVTLRLEEAPAALCVMSGTLLTEGEWRRRAAQRRGLKVLQSHGRYDDLLPFEAALWLKDLLEASGIEVEFVPFDDGHTIPAEVVARLGALISGFL